MAEGVVSPELAELLGRGQGTITGSKAMPEGWPFDRLTWNDPVYEDRLDRYRANQLEGQRVLGLTGAAGAPYSTMDPMIPVESRVMAGRRGWEDWEGGDGTPAAVAPTRSPSVRVPAAEGPGLTGMSAADLFRRTEASVPAEGPMLDGLPARALLRGYADPGGLDVVSGPSPRAQSIIDEAAMRRVLEQRRRDTETFRRPQVVFGQGVPPGFPSQDPRDQAARYEASIQQLAPLVEERDPRTPIERALEDAQLRRRLSELPYR